MSLIPFSHHHTHSQNLSVPYEATVLCFLWSTGAVALCPLEACSPVKSIYSTFYLSPSTLARVAVTAHEAWPRGATPHPRSGAEAGRTPCSRGSRQEELPNVRGQGQRPRVPGCNGAEMAEKSYPMSQVRSGGREEQPHVQGAVAVWESEGLKELFHVQGREGQQ